jgi:hypothetical protein
METATKQRKQTVRLTQEERALLQRYVSLRHKQGPVRDQVLLNEILEKRMFAKDINIIHVAEARRNLGIHYRGQKKNASIAGTPLISTEPKAKPGRPKGSPNKDKPATSAYAQLVQLQEEIEKTIVRHSDELRALARSVEKVRRSV